jgi:hypothetical protein
LPNIDRVTQRGWGLIIKLQSFGAIIIRLSQNQPLFARGLSIFLFFVCSLRAWKIRFPLEKTILVGPLELEPLAILDIVHPKNDNVDEDETSTNISCLICFIHPNILTNSFVL